MLRSCGEGCVAVTLTESAKVRGIIVEALSKVSGSLDTDRLFGVIDDEAVTHVDQKVAPLVPQRVWKVVENSWLCVICNFSGIEEIRGYRYLRSAGATIIVPPFLTPPPPPTNRSGPSI